MPEENMNQEFRLKKIDEINYLIEEIDWNELMSQRDKSVCRALNYIDHSLIAFSTIKFGFHCSDELCCPPSLLVINLMGTIEGLPPNLHCWWWLGR